MRKRMRSRRLEFSPDSSAEDYRAGRGCFFCRHLYHMEHALPGDLVPKDIMHVVARSHLGLGVEQNGVLGCRYHHSLLVTVTRDCIGKWIVCCRTTCGSFIPDGRRTALPIINGCNTSPAGAKEAADSNLLGSIYHGCDR